MRMRAGGRVDKKCQALSIGEKTLVNETKKIYKGRVKNVNNTK